MLNKIQQVLFVLISLPVLAFSQNCTLELKGKIEDASTGLSINYANVFIEERQKGAVTDSTGSFRIGSICKGSYHLVVSHVGCETQRIFLTIENDTTIQIALDHYAQELEHVVVVGKADAPTTQHAESLNEHKIAENSDKNLSNLLETISGVSVLKNGNGIAKPIVHGLYGNRLTILNNGVAQSGQQWGNDHSPEIDPLVANRISVVKGVGALAYQGSSLGSVILVEPNKIGKEPHLHGKASYFFESNGLGNGLNVQFQKYTPSLAWRLVGTLKKSGDKHTPDYFLRNTGHEEGNIALQLEKSFSERWHSSLYISSFNTRLGVLRGSHISNLTDLEAALEQDVPFFTEPDFTYTIEAPFQKVNHHLLKLQSKYFINDEDWLEINYAVQLNDRKEFDVRRGGRTKIPALSLQQLTNFVEGKYHALLPQNRQLKAGLQFRYIFNANNPETGVLPLIPDYVNSEGGAFVTLNQSFDKWLLEIGGRYDYLFQKVATLSKTVPVEILRYQNNFHNYSATGGATYEFSETFHLTYNLGYATRNPAINELYSNGLHQGVSGIEEGDINLKKEKSFKTTLSVEGRVKEKLLFETLLYYQLIDDYIFLNPQDEFRLTIRGAFPVFKYEQTNAQIYGLDLSMVYFLSEAVKGTVKYSYINGRDQINNLPLILMPSNNIYGALNYQIPNVGQFENVEIELNNKYVFEQTNILPVQDFVAPPSAYNLLGLKIAAQRQFKQSRLNIHLKVENLLNVVYRDYLNRQRYFADDVGRNFVFGVNWSF